MSGSADDGAVAISWQKDRKRYSRVLNEFPGFHRLRLAAALALAGSAVIVTFVLATEPTAPMIALALMPGLLTVTCYVGARRAVLSEIGTGTLTWRFDGHGLRVEGTTATEVPWSQMVRWRRGAGHLVIEVRRPSGKTPNSALAAPLEAMSEPASARIEEMLRTHIR